MIKKIVYLLLVCSFAIAQAQAYVITNNSDKRYHFEVLNSDTMYVFHEFNVLPGESYTHKVAPLKGNNLLYYKAYPDKSSFWVWQYFQGNFSYDSTITISKEDGKLKIEVT